MQRIIADHPCAICGKPSCQVVQDVREVLVEASGYFYYEPVGNWDYYCGKHMRKSRTLKARTGPRCATT